MSRSSGGIQYLLKHGRASIPVNTRTTMPQMKGLKKLAAGGPIDDQDKSGPLGANRFYPGANIQASSGGLTDVGFNNMLGQEQKFADGGEVSPANAFLGLGFDKIFKPAAMLQTPNITFDEQGRPIMPKWSSGTYSDREKPADTASAAPAYDPLAALAAQRGSRDGGGGLSRDGGLAGNGTNFTDDQWATIKQMNDEYGMLGNPVNRISLEGGLSLLAPTVAKMLGMYRNPFETQPDAVTAISNYQGSNGINAALQRGYDVGPSVNSRAARDAADANAAAAAQGGGGAGSSFSGYAPSGNEGMSLASQYASYGEGRGSSSGGGDGGGGAATGGNNGDASGGGDRGTRGGFAAGGIAALAGGGAAPQGPRMLKGGGDGLSDSIPAVIGKGQPARLADGEFVVSADVVSALGGGSTDAGARKLYKMMDRIRKSAHGTKKQVKPVSENKVLPA